MINLSLQPNSGPLNHWMILLYTDRLNSYSCFIQLFFTCSGYRTGSVLTPKFVVFVRFPCFSCFSLPFLLQFRHPIYRSKNFLCMKFGTEILGLFSFCLELEKWELCIWILQIGFFYFKIYAKSIWSKGPSTRLEWRWKIFQQFFFLYRFQFCSKSIFQYRFQTQFSRFFTHLVKWAHWCEMSVTVSFRFLDLILKWSKSWVWFQDSHFPSFKKSSYNYYISHPNFYLWNDLFHLFHVFFINLSSLLDF